jgi:phosphatidyl-myo-inositol alpha-mannosyltransferase
MRVGLVCPYSFDVPGGVQSHVRGLARALAARGHDVSVLAPGVSAHSGSAYESAGPALPIPFNGSIARVAFGRRAVTRTREWLAAGRFDVVHVHEPFAPSVTLLALRFADVPVVATFHASTDLTRAVAGAVGLARAAAPRLAAAIAVSPSAQETWAGSHGLRATIVPNGVCCSAFESSQVAPPASRRTVLFLGRRDEPRKGLPVLRAAFALVSRELPDARLLVAGPGPRRPRPWSRPAPCSVVELGAVSDERRVRLLAAADVFVAPNTLGESFGLVLAEAMASGTAVAASDLPAFRDLLGDGRYGMLFAPGDAESCARALTGLLRDAARRQRLAEAGRRAVRRYDWSRIAPQVVAVYESVLGERRPASAVRARRLLVGRATARPRTMETFPR